MIDRKEDILYNEHMLWDILGRRWHRDYQCKPQDGHSELLFRLVFE